MSPLSHCRRCHHCSMLAQGSNSLPSRGSLPPWATLSVPSPGLLWIPAPLPPVASPPKGPGT